LAHNKRLAEYAHEENGEKLDSIFEIIDRTMGDRYYLLGLFLEFEDAKEEIEEWPEDERISRFSDEEYERIEIVERKLGWSGDGNIVFTLERRGAYDQKKVGYYWRNFYNQKKG